MFPRPYNTNNNNKNNTTKKNNNKNKNFKKKKKKKNNKISHNSPGLQPRACQTLSIRPPSSVSKIKIL